MDTADVEERPGVRPPLRLDCSAQQSSREQQPEPTSTSVDLQDARGWGMGDGGEHHGALRWDLALPSVPERRDVDHLGPALDVARDGRVHHRLVDRRQQHLRPLGELPVHRCVLGLPAGDARGRALSARAEPPGGRTSHDRGQIGPGAAAGAGGRARPGGAGPPARVAGAVAGPDGFAGSEGPIHTGGRAQERAGAVEGAGGRGRARAGAGAPARGLLHAVGHGDVPRLLQQLGDQVRRLGHRGRDAGANLVEAGRGGAAWPLDAAAAGVGRLPIGRRPAAAERGQLDHQGPGAIGDLQPPVYSQSAIIK